MHSGGHSQAVASWEFVNVFNSAAANQPLCENEKKNKRNCNTYIVIVIKITRSTHASDPIMIFYLLFRFAWISVRAGAGGEGHSDLPS